MLACHEKEEDPTATGVPTQVAKIRAEKARRAIVGALLFEYELRPLYTRFYSVSSLWARPELKDYDDFRESERACLTYALDQDKLEPDGVAQTPQTSDILELPAKALNPISTSSASTSMLLSTEEIVKQFYSSNRLKFSDQLVAQYSSQPDDLARALVASILPPENDKSYRVNLYIALTLARLTKGWPKAADPNDAIGQLIRTNNYIRDFTFRRRVNEALANRVPPP